MNRITEITKRDILDLFRSGIDRSDGFIIENLIYRYYGRLDEVEFLKRLYDLNSIPSFDSRYPNAEGDIFQHTVNNDDYPFCWVFEDARFHLMNGSDELYLKFICEIFHPVVRYEKGCWNEFLIEVNKLLQNDGYELYPTEKISNHNIYGWRIYQSKDGKMFIPFSQRNAEAIKDKKISLTIKRSARNQIYQLLTRYDEVYQETSDTGWHYNISTSEKVFSDIKQFYTPRCYNDQKQYIETADLQDFICNSSPYCIMDLIEFFEKYHNQSRNFETQINTILKLNGITYKLDKGKMVSAFAGQLESSALAKIQEVGLKELIQEATKYYDEDNLAIAVEKLWDALERLKTYYSPALDKKKSVNRIVDNMSGMKEPYRDLFEKEFHELTSIGNNFRIRHHEISKIDIEDKRHYDYFYKRCLSLISTAIQFLDSGGIV